MTKLRGFGLLRYRLLAIVALLICLIALWAPAASPQISCCSQCLKRWQQCDANDIVCCQIYTSCVQQCQTPCSSCPQ